MSQAFPDDVDVAVVSHNGRQTLPLVFSAFSLAGVPADRIQYAGAQLHFLCEAVNPWNDRPLAERGSNAADIGTAAGVTLLLSVAAAKCVGGFDDRYFMGKEDGEFCYRLRLGGFRIVETPQAVVRHGSRPRSTWLFPYQVRNRWHFMLKNYAFSTLLVLTPALAMHEVVQLGFLTAKGELGAWLKGLTGLLRLVPDLGGDRRAVAALRQVADRDILTGAPLVVRADLVGGGAAAKLKKVYDAWLGAYWRIAQRLLPRSSSR